MSETKDTIEYWRWQEYHRVVPDKKLEKQGPNNGRR